MPITVTLVVQLFVVFGRNKEEEEEAMSLLVFYYCDCFSRRPSFNTGSPGSLFVPRTCFITCVNIENMWGKV